MSDASWRNADISVDDVSVQLITLNDGQSLLKSVNSLLCQHPGEFFVIDGGSNPDSRAILDDLPVPVISSVRGMLSQTLTGNSLITKPFVLVAEADHYYPPYFLRHMLEEFMKSDFDGMQGQLRSPPSSNFFGHGHEIFLEIHNNPRIPRKIIACPQLWRTDTWKLLIQSCKNSQGFSFDTERAEKILELGLKVGVGEPTCFEQDIQSYSRFRSRTRNYGRGDHFFYQSHKTSWSLRRKAKSMTHIAKQYFVKYPFVALRNGEVKATFYLVMLGGFRYFAWLKEAVTSQNRIT